MAETPLLPKPTPVGLPSSNPLFRALDILTGGIAGAVTGDNVKRRVRDEQLQNAIEAQAREEAIRQQIMANRRNEAEGLGLDPMTATASQIEAAREAKQLSFSKRQREQAAEMERAAKARELGIDPTAKPAMAGPVNPFASPSVISAMTVGQQKPLEQQIAEKEMARKVEQAAAESKARAEATAPYENQYSQGDNMAVNGQFVGRAVRNNRTGEYGIMGQDGKITPIPEGAQPITPTAINKNIVSATDFKKFKTDLTDSERSLRQFERYANSVGGLDQGVASLADKVTAGFKTLFGSGKLNPDELARAAATGQLQGLLGGNRVSVVGGGVLTEQDAARIIQRLGGDVGALQNREVVMKALGELYQDRFAQYQDDFNFYNEAVDSYWGKKGFKRAPETTFNKLFGAQAVNGNTQAPAAPVAAPVQTSFDEAKMKRLQELRNKAGQR
jgi:hypothetical protein